MCYYTLLSCTHAQLCVKWNHSIVLTYMMISVLLKLIEQHCMQFCRQKLGKVSEMTHLWRPQVILKSDDGFLASGHQPERVCLPESSSGDICPVSIDSGHVVHQPQLLQLHSHCAQPWHNQGKHCNHTNIRMVAVFLYVFGQSAGCQVTWSCNF